MIMISILGDSVAESNRTVPGQAAMTIAYAYTHIHNPFFVIAMVLLTTEAEPNYYG